MLPTKIKNDIIEIKKLFNNYKYMKKNKEELEQIKTSIIDIINNLDIYDNKAIVDLVLAYNEHMKDEVGILNSKYVMDTGEFYENCANVKLKFKSFLNKIERRINTLQIGVIEFTEEQNDSFYDQILNYIYEDEIDLIEQLLNENIIDVNYVPALDEDDEDEFNIPLIIAACQNNNLRVVKMLHNNNANLNVNIDDEYEDDTSPLLAAISSSNQNDVELITYLLDNGASPNFLGGLQQLPLNEVTNNPTLYEKMIIEYGADVNFEYFGGSPLIWACETVSFDAIKILLDNGADVNHINNERQTGLHYLITEFDLIQDIDKVKISIDWFVTKNFNFNLQNDLGNTVIHNLADLDVCVDIVKHLLDKNIVYNVNLVNYNGDTVLHCLINNYKNENEEIIIQIIELFVKYNFNFDLQNNLGDTVLHNAIKIEVSSNIIKYLLNNANNSINIANSDGKTILQLAKECKNQEIFTIINNYQISDFDNIDEPSTSTRGQKRKYDFDEDDDKKCCPKK